MEDPRDLPSPADGRETVYTSRMSRKIRVGLVFGGRSCEHEVSLASALSVFEAIDRTRYELTLIHIAKDGEWLLRGGADPIRLAGAGGSVSTAGDAGGQDAGDATRTAEAGNPPSIEWAARAEDPAGGGAGGTSFPLSAARPDPDDDSTPVLMGYPDGGRLLARGIGTAAPIESAGAGAAGFEAGAHPSLDVVFPLLHGPFGEDGTVQGLLELAGLPYVGAGVLGSAAAMDKAMMKRAFRAEGLPMMDYLAVRRSEWRRDPDRVQAKAEGRLGYPMFVKPANLGSSVGVHRIDDSGAFHGRVGDAAAYDTKVLIEAAALDCHEVECAVLGNDEPRASVVGEIVPSREFYDYDAKYVDDASKLVIPAPLPPETAERVRALSLAAFRAVDARGLSRVDFFVERGGERRVYVNEVNTMPGFTPISMYPKLWAASGISYPDLIDRLIQLAIEEHRDRRDVRAVL